MKQLLFTLAIFITTLTSSLANDVLSYENTTWNVIRERLFNGESTKT